MKLGKSKVVLLAVMCLVGMAQAVDLKTVYRDACLNDPTFKQARADWLSRREGLPIAASKMLPEIGFSGSVSRARSARNIEAMPASYVNVGGYSFNVSQRIFDFATMATIWATQADVGAAYATYLAAGQDLLQRTIRAYLNVLYAQDVLYFRQARKSSTHRLYEQARHKFKEGLIAITDLEEAKKDYDLAIAEEIGARNDLDCQLEALEEISGVKYRRLDILKDDVKLVLPSPRKIEAWVHLAELQNYGLKAAGYQTLVAKQSIKKAAAGHMPTVSASGGYSYRNSTTNMAINERTKGLEGGLSLDMPVFSGGGVTAAVNQAHYLYQKAVAEQDYTYKKVVSDTRQAYLGIVSYASKVQADLQAIVSGRSALQATYASYTVGSRTMADVLTAQSQLYETQTQCARDRYQYILEWITLKQQVGALGNEDLERINGWLTSHSRKNADLLSAEDLFGADEVQAAVTANSLERNSGVGSTDAATGTTTTAVNPQNAGGAAQISGGNNNN